MRHFMKKTEEMVIKYGSLKDVELPNIIYKYRDWSETYHKRFISHLEIFFASPETFEDNFDCCNPTRFDLLTKEQIYEYFMWSSKIDNPNFTRQQHRFFARNWSKKSAVNDKRIVKEFIENSVKEYYKHQGILSLTENHNNDFMWQKYANKETGFCIGYNTRELFQFLGSGGEVEYVDELPIILPEPFMEPFVAMRNQIFFKHNKWNEEEEYRTSKFYPNIATIEDRQVKIPKKCFNKIIIGSNMIEENKVYLKAEILEKIGEIEIIERKNVA